MTNFKDGKREFSRISTDFIIEFSKIKENHEPYYGKCVDLSALGLRITTSHKLEEAERISFKVFPPNKSDLPLEGRAQVIEVNYRPDSEDYLTRLSIEEMY